MSLWICRYRAVFCSLNCPKSENVVCFGLGEHLEKCEKSSQVATCKKIQIFGGPKVGSDEPLDMQISNRFLFIDCPKSENVVSFGLGEHLEKCEKSSQVVTCKKIQIFGAQKWVQMSR